VVGAGARDDAVIFRLGSTFPLDGPSVSARVFETGRPAQVDDYAGAEGTVAAMVRTTDIRSSIGVPITVDGALWGAMIVGTTGDPLPADTEDRLRQFTELAATAVSSANAREGLRRLAEEQAALRRVATLVAEVPASTELFAAVIDEASQLLKVPIISMARFEPDGTATVIAAPPGAAFAAGTNLALNGPSVIASIRETGLSARIEDYAGLDGEVATGLRTINAQSGFGSPFIVDGKVWGAIAAAVSDDSPAPDGAEARLLAFTELVATAISNTESRERVRGLAEEQATLRRVATLVAEGEADQLFERVAQEIIQLLDVPVVFVNRYGPGEVFTVLAAHARDGATLFPVGSTWPLDGPTVATEIFRTGQSARVDNYEVIEGTIASSVRSAGVVSSVGVPITVDGAVWGAIVVSTMSEPLPAGMEIQLRDFTDLIGTAISNAATRAQLVASRARLVEAGDEARRRVERNLHDGTQQRLIALGLDLQQIRALIPPIHDAAHSGFERVEHDLESVLEEVRELSRGLHPALLLRGGLSPALRALARRSPIKVNLKINVPERPASSIESATYYIVSEALTNAIKHSRASTISITIATDRSRAKLRAEIADDGVGGAEPSEGSGLMGAIDRVDALGGRLTIDSRGGNGTTISFELPLVASEEPFTGSVSS
jgi:signal transduction histidine kinase